MSLVTAPPLDAVLASSTPAWPGMSAREREAWLLARCAAAGRGRLSIADDLREASVFVALAGAVRSRRPEAARHLANAASAYLDRHDEQRIPLDEMMRRNWLPGMSRLRDSLLRLL